MRQKIVGILKVLDVRPIPSTPDGNKGHGWRVRTVVRPEDAGEDTELSFDVESGIVLAVLETALLNRKINGRWRQHPVEIELDEHGDLYIVRVRDEREDVCDGAAGDLGTDFELEAILSPTAERFKETFVWVFFGHVGQQKCNQIKGMSLDIYQQAVMRWMKNESVVIGLDDAGMVSSLVGSK